MPSPRHREPLTRARIIDAATAIIDEQGLEVLSMRMVAARLDAGVMSLYRHVADRDELQDLALAQMTAEISLPTGTGQWREDLADIARTFRAALATRPGLTALLSSRGGQAKAGLVLLDAAIGPLRAAGFKPQEAVLAGSTLGGFVAGAALRELADHTTTAGANSSTKAHGVGLDDKPRLEQVEWARSALISVSSDELFEVGLQIILDGIESVLRPEQDTGTR